MNGKDLLEAMGHVDEKYVDEAEYRTLKRRLPVGWLSVAACLCLLIGGAMFLLKPGYSNDCAAMPESNSGSNMAMDSNVAETDAAMTATGSTLPSLLAPGESGGAIYGSDPDDNEPHELILWIEEWKGDHFVATVRTQGWLYPSGTEVTVYFAEDVCVNGEYRQPKEDEFSEKDMVEVLCYPRSDSEEGTSITVVSIILMPPPG